MGDKLTPREPAAGATLACAAGVTPERLSTWRDGLLPADEAEWLATHAAGCLACGARLRDYDQIGAALRGQRIPQLADDPWPAMQRRLTGERRGRRPALPAWGGLSALVAAALLVALFAGLLAHQAALRPAMGVTPTVARATVTATSAATPSPAAWTLIPEYQGLYGLAVAPSEPQVAYQLWNDASGALILRRTDDEGATWHALTLPYIAHADYPVTIGAWSHFVTNPLDARVVYLDIYAAMHAPITTCSSNAGGQDSSKSPLCLYQYISVDSGAHWRLLSLPVVGSVSVVQAQSEADTQPSSRVYGVISALGKVSRLARSDDGGLNWRLIDAPILAAGQSVARYSAPPTGSTIFALAEPAGTQPGTFPALTIWRSDDAGATWMNLGQAPSVSGYSMQAAMVVNSGKPLLYLVTTATSYSGLETIQGSLFGDSGSFLTAPDTTPRCTADNGSEFVGARADGSVIIWCGGALQSWLATPARAVNSSWRTLTQDPAVSSIQSSFMQTLPDGSTRLWLVTQDNKAAEVQYTTLPK